MSNIKTRAHYMKSEHKVLFDVKPKIPRTHANCMQMTKVCRPGKTAQDRARRTGGRQDE